jgi:hypothetical protein
LDREINEPSGKKTESRKAPKETFSIVLAQ